MAGRESPLARRHPAARRHTLTHTRAVVYPRQYRIDKIRERAPRPAREGAPRETRHTADCRPERAPALRAALPPVYITAAARRGRHAPSSIHGNGTHTTRVRSQCGRHTRRTLAHTAQYTTPSKTKFSHTARPVHGATSVGVSSRRRRARRPRHLRARAARCTGHHHRRPGPATRHEPRCELSRSCECAAQWWAAVGMRAPAPLSVESWKHGARGGGRGACARAERTTARLSSAGTVGTLRRVRSHWPFGRIGTPPLMRRPAWLSARSARRPTQRGGVRGSGTTRGRVRRRNPRTSSAPRTAACESRFAPRRETAGKPHSRPHPMAAASRVAARLADLSHEQLAEVAVHGCESSPELKNNVPTRSSRRWHGGPASRG